MARTAASPSRGMAPMGPVSCRARRWMRRAGTGARPSAACAAKPRRARRICRRKTRSCSRWRMPRRPNGTAPTSPGSSSSFCSCRTIPSYKIFDERFPFLFNSYYVAAGPRHARPQRGLITRPNGEDVAGYRAHVDEAVERLIESVPAADAPRVFEILEIGLHHEQQHQELLVTDILHAFAQNPTDPAYDANWKPPRAAHGPRGVSSMCRPASTPIGHDGDGFCFDNETPRARRTDRRHAHRAPSRHQCRMARIHRGRRLRDALALAVGRLGGRAGGRLAGARLLAAERRRLVMR